MYRPIGFAFLLIACAATLALLPSRIRAQIADPDAFGRVAGESAARLLITPRHAEVYIDGVRVGRVDDFDGFTQRLRVSAGDHQIDLYAEGYRTFHRKVRFARGQTYRIVYEMQPLGSGEIAEPPPQKPPALEQARDVPARPEPEASRTFGTLSVRVQPADARIRIDGDRWNGPEGQARLVVDLGEGLHRLEIDRDGYRSYSTNVRIRRGDITTLNVILPKQER